MCILILACHVPCVLQINLSVSFFWYVYVCHICTYVFRVFGLVFVCDNYVIACHETYDKCAFVRLCMSVCVCVCLILCHVCWICVFVCDKVLLRVGSASFPNQPQLFGTNQQKHL